MKGECGRLVAWFGRELFFRTDKNDDLDGMDFDLDDISLPNRLSGLKIAHPGSDG